MHQSMETLVTNIKKRLLPPVLWQQATTEEAIMPPKELTPEENPPKIRLFLQKKITIYTFIKLFLVLAIVTFGTMAAYAIIATATKEPITLIGLGLMGLVIASTYMKNQ